MRFPALALVAVAATEEGAPQPQLKQQKRVELFVRLVILFVVAAEAGACCCYCHPGVAGAVEMGALCMGVLLMAAECLRVGVMMDAEYEWRLERLPSTPTHPLPPAPWSTAMRVAAAA